MAERVTWLLPVKNGMPYLPETLASIEAQTYRNWEVLAWDNGSTDGTLEVLSQWIPSRLPGRLVADRPLGLGASLAEMVKLCQTELCARIDADDVNAPVRLERQVAFLREHPEVAVVGSTMNHLGADGVNHGLLCPLPTRHDDIVHLLLSRNRLGHPSVLFRRSAVLRVGNYRDLSPVEDYDLWLRIAVHYSLANLGAPLLDYRIHDKSVSQTAIADDRLSHDMVNCLCANAPALYGCSEQELRSLVGGRHGCAILVLWRMARYLQRTQGGSLKERLRSDSFVSVSRCFMAPKDRISRLCLWILDRHKPALSHSLLAISKRCLKLPGIHRLLRTVHRSRSAASPR